MVAVWPKAAGRQKVFPGAKHSRLKRATRWNTLSSRHRSLDKPPSAKVSYLGNYWMFLTPFSIAAIAIVVILSAYLSFQEQNNMTPKPKLNVHSFPRPPLLEKTSRHLVIKWGSNGNETMVADTRDGYWALETTHPPSMLSH